MYLRKLSRILILCTSVTLLTMPAFGQLVDQTLAPNSYEAPSCQETDIP
jgi:hypothetical protein